MDRSPILHPWPSGSTWAELREKSITRTGQDRTGQQKSYKSVIFHIFGGKASRKDIAMEFGTVVDVLEVRGQSLILKI